MTALLFYLEPEQLCVAMDTRTLDIDDDTQQKQLGPLCSKMLLVPHLQGVICCTGIRSLAFQWHSFVQQSTVAHDMADLDKAAAVTLPGLARQCGVTPEFTATVYHFGYSRANRGFVGRVFRSTDGFEPEEIECPSLGIKPPDELDYEWALKTCQEQGLLDGFVEIMRRQKAIDDAKPIERRVGIGGEIQLLAMTAEECSIRTCHRFEDYDRDMESLARRLQREAADIKQVPPARD